MFWMNEQQVVTQSRPRSIRQLKNRWKYQLDRNSLRSLHFQ